MTMISMSNHPLISILWRTSNRHKRARELVISSATGIVEQQFVSIGGIEQWISIRGEDRNNPILLRVGADRGGARRRRVYHREVGVMACGTAGQEDGGPAGVRASPTGP